MNFVSNSLKIYIHMIFIMIYLQMKCFRNFPTFLLKCLTLRIMQEKNYRLIMIIYCDSIKS